MTDTEQIDEQAQTAVDEALQPTSSDESADQGETGTDTHEQPDEAVSEPENANAEAARYRRRLRDAEAERDDLRAQVEALQRAEVERIAGEHLQAPRALWPAGVELGDLVADDGTIDAHAVAEAAQQAREQLGLARPPAGNYVPHAGSNPQMPETGPASPADRAAAVIRGPQT